MNQRELIEAKQPGPIVEFHSAVLDAPLFLRRWTGNETKAFWVFCQGKTTGEITAKTVQLTLANEDGSLVYPEKELMAVGKLRNAFLEEIAAEAAKLNLLTILHLREFQESFFKTRANAGSTGSPATSANSDPNASSKN